MNKCAAPNVRYESQGELRDACLDLLSVYVELTHRVVGEALRARGLPGMAWTELDRLMLGIASLEEVVQSGLHLVLASTRGNGALYAHDLNARLTRGINQHNRLFFHRTTSLSEAELHASLSAMLGRMLLTSHNSHYHVLLDDNFKRCVAWDGDEWLLCPWHQLREYQAAVVSAQTLSVLHDDVILEILALLGMSAKDTREALGDSHPRGR
jgi:hypothetical protein